MFLKRRLLLSMVALTAIAATGCGRNLGPTTAAPKSASSAQAFTAGGTTRNFGYNVERYRTVLEKRAHKVHLPPRQGLMPTKVDLRENCAPIYNQGQLGSCTAFAMGKGLREFMQRKNHEKLTELSALWLYYEERKHMGSEYIGKDSGANMADGMWVLENEGCAIDAFWPYVPNAFTEKPRDTAYATAADWKIEKSVELASFEDVKKALANGNPVAFGFVVYLRFQFIGHDGMMKMPWKFEPKMGGHAVVAVGYDDAMQRLIVRNSWGDGWGDHGYFYMPYEFAKDKEKAMEFYTAL